MPLLTVPSEESTPLHEENWIQSAIKRPGQLHRDLGVPQGKKIPKGMVAAAAKRKGKVGQRARLAQTLSGFSRSKQTKESNDCHEPAGQPTGGQFCSKGGGDSWARSGGGSGGDFAATMGVANKVAAERKKPQIRVEPRQGQRNVLKVISVGGRDVGMVSRNGPMANWKLYRGVGEAAERIDIPGFPTSKINQVVAQHFGDTSRGTGPGLSRAKQRVARREAMSALGRNLRAYHGLPEPK